jgi:hypothetical protein
MVLEGFEITEHEDRTYSADPAVECPQDGCGFTFFITRSRVELITPKAK